MQMIESLEQRKLLSATVTARVTGDHILVVEGTDAAEIYNVGEIAPHTVGVFVTDVNTGNTLLDQVYTGVDGVKVMAKGGDDQINWSGQTIAAIVDGGSGNDTIFTFDRGSVGSVVKGGNGNDTIFVDNSSVVGFDDTYGVPVLAQGHAITGVDGGEGGDTINIQNGSSAIISAGSGNDGILINGITNPDGTFDTTQEAHAFVDGGSGFDTLAAFNADVIYIRIESATVVDPV